MSFAIVCFFFSCRRRHTRSYGDWSSDVCSSDLKRGKRFRDHARGRRLVTQHEWWPLRIGGQAEWLGADAAEPGKAHTHRPPRQRFPDIGGKGDYHATSISSAVPHVTATLRSAWPTPRALRLSQPYATLKAPNMPGCTPPSRR